MGGRVLLIDPHRCSGRRNQTKGLAPSAEGLTVAGTGLSCKQLQRWGIFKVDAVTAERDGQPLSVLLAGSRSCGQST